MKKFSLILIAATISLFWSACRKPFVSYPQKTLTSFNNHIIFADTNGVFTLKEGEISLWPNDLSSKSSFFYNGNISSGSFIIQEGLLHMYNSSQNESFSISKTGQTFNIQKLNLAFNRAHLFDTVMCFLQKQEYDYHISNPTLMFTAKNLTALSVNRIQSFDAIDFARTSDSSLFLIKTNGDCMSIFPNSPNFTRINHENIADLTKPLAEKMIVKYEGNFLFIMKENMVFVNTINNNQITNQSTIK